MADILNIVDEHGMIIGEASRNEIHRKGLLHREIHVWLYTPAGEVIFQLRGMHKDTFPNLLDASVGGHVDRGMGWEDTALKELQEETGIHATVADLQFIREEREKAYDPVTNTTNNALRYVYAYCFRGDVSSLNVETGEAQGFEAWTINQLLNLSPNERTRFIPEYVEPVYFDLYRRIVKLSKT